MIRHRLVAAVFAAFLVPADALADWARWDCVDEESSAGSCTALSTNPDNGAYLAVTFFSTEPGRYLQRIMLGSAGWSAPEGQGARVIFTARPSGEEQSLAMKPIFNGLYAMYDGVPGPGMSSYAVEKVIAILESEGETVFLDFPDGTRWEVPLAGARTAIHRARSMDAGQTPSPD